MCRTESLKVVKLVQNKGLTCGIGTIIASREVHQFEKGHLQQCWYVRVCKIFHSQNPIVLLTICIALVLEEFVRVTREVFIDRCNFSNVNKGGNDTIFFIVELMTYISRS